MRAARASHNLANLNTEGFRPLRAGNQLGEADSMDPAEEMVESISAERSFEVNAKAVRSADETWRSLIDILA